MWSGIFAFGGATINAIKASGQGASLAATSNVNATNVGKGYDSFKAFKKVNGSAGPGKQWHHIVEQSQIQKSGFSPRQIHNTNNLIAIDSKIHAKISGYYSSVYGKAGMTTRNWLGGQSFDNQYKFGLEIIKFFGGL